MNTRPRRCCPKMACPGTIGTDGLGCDVCGAGKSQPQGTSAERGYDRQWRNVRARKLRADPLCERCLTEGIETLAEQVHHKQPFKGRDDPLRLAWSNLESICRECHEKVRQL